MKPEPDWDIPYPYGWPAAIESMGSISAPLLAGISIALTTLVISTEGLLRWPNAALFLLVGASLTLVGTVQATFWARRYAVTPAELAEWWGDTLKGPRLERVIDEQRNLARSQKLWATRAGRLYNAGLLLLLLAIPTMLVPKGGASDTRLAGIALALLGFGIECIWIGSTEKRALSQLLWWR